jgi:hypothetical protein
VGVWRWVGVVGAVSKAKGDARFCAQEKATAATELVSNSTTLQAEKEPTQRHVTQNTKQQLTSIASPVTKLQPRRLRADSPVSADRWARPASVISSPVKCSSISCRFEFGWGWLGLEVVGWFERVAGR